MRQEVAGSPYRPEICSVSLPGRTWACKGILPPPAAPSNLTAVALDEHTIRLQWTDNSGDEEGFFFISRLVPPCAFRPNKVPANTTTHDWGGLLPGAELCVRIAAFNFGGNSPSVPSTGVCATVHSRTLNTVWTDDANPDGRGVGPGPIRDWRDWACYRRKLPAMRFDRHTVIVLVLRPDAPAMTEEEAADLQDRHLASGADLQARGLVRGRGPLTDQDDPTLRGLSVWSVDADTARELASGDPAVQAGPARGDGHDLDGAGGECAVQPGPCASLHGRGHRTRLTPARDRDWLPMAWSLPQRSAKYSTPFHIAGVDSTQPPTFMPHSRVGGPSVGHVVGVEVPCAVADEEHVVHHHRRTPRARDVDPPALLSGHTVEADDIAGVGGEDDDVLVERRRTQDSGLVAHLVEGPPHDRIVGLGGIELEHLPDLTGPGVVLLLVDPDVEHALLVDGDGGVDVVAVQKRNTWVGASPALSRLRSQPCTRPDELAK